MAVLIECISVVVIRSRLESLYPGGLTGFIADCPNATLCADACLVRVGFMAPQDARLWVDGLVTCGLKFVHDGVAADIAVVDQVTGPTGWCPWLEVGTVDIADGSVRVCRLAGDTDQALITPADRTYAGSLSAVDIGVPKNQIADTLQFLRHENGLDVVLNRLTGKIIHIARTSQTPIVRLHPKSEKDLN